AWRRGRLRPVLAGGLVAGGVAAVVVAPWLARNVLTFGTPFYSTEQHDAWVLKYDPQWEAIYRVYAGRLDLPHPRLLVGYGFDRTTGAIWKQFRDLWGDLSGGAIVPLLALLLAVVGACTLTGQRQRALLGAVVAAATPYLLFVLVYWHYEERYVLLLLPW